MKETRRNYILGLTGDHGAGKDSCAQALARHGYLSVAFADALRGEVCGAFHMGVRLLTNRDTKELPTHSLALVQCLDPQFVLMCKAAGHELTSPRSPRWILQQWGTEYRRAQDPDYWAKQVRNWIERKVGTGWRYFVVTDVIFPNEAAMLRAMGGQIIRVHRRDGVSRLTPDTAYHASKRMPLICSDGDIMNDGTLAGLPEKVEHEVLFVMGSGGLCQSEAQGPAVFQQAGVM
mgnify:CR=1 FL=1